MNDCTWTAAWDEAPKWSDVSADRILADLRRAAEEVERWEKRPDPVVIVYAGQDAYALLRQEIPEGDELVRLSECSALERDQFLVIKNEDISYLGEKSKKTIGDMVKLFKLVMPESGNSEGGPR